MSPARRTDRRRWRGGFAVASLLTSVAVAAAASATGPAVVTERAVRVDPPARRVTIIAGGDVLTESRVRAAAADHAGTSGARFDFRPMFEPVAPTIRAADLAICNQELPISPPGGRYGFNGRSLFGGNRLLSPYEIAGGLAHAGFDRCSTATNHALDDGLTGIATTIAALGDAGISTAGTARSADEAVPAVIDTGQALVGHLAITRSLNDPRPGDPWRVNARPSVAEVLGDLRGLRSRGAEIVVLSMHVGTELLRGPTASDRAYVTELAASGTVDAVVVHGPHVVQPFEVVAGTAVWWSLGNFVSEMGPPSVGRYADARTSDGVLAWIDATQGADGRWSVIPSTIAICNDFVDRTVRRPTQALDDGVADDRVRGELERCLARIRAIIPDVD